MPLDRSKPSESLARHNPVIRALCQRLRAAGKPAKVALVTGMRKLLTVANAVLRAGVPWSPAVAGTA